MVLSKRQKRFLAAITYLLASLNSDSLIAEISMVWEIYVNLQARKLLCFSYLLLLFCFFFSFFILLLTCGKAEFVLGA